MPPEKPLKKTRVPRGSWDEDKLAALGQTVAELHVEFGAGGEHLFDGARPAVALAHYPPV